MWPMHGEEGRHRRSDQGGSGGRPWWPGWPCSGGKALEGFQPRSDMMRLVFLKNNFGCCMENSLEKIV